MCRVSYTILTCRFTGMQLKVFVREPSEDVPQCRDTYPGKNGKRYEVIPIHAPAWGATLWQSGRSSLCLFQSTRPRGARQGTPVGCVLHMMFQSTRPRGARRYPRISGYCVPQFQSTRPRGARRSARIAASRCETFQSTRPRGARPVRELHNLLSEEVSIHAPAWGATHVPHCACYSAASFNPRARVGRDVKGKLLGVLLFLFQSTRPRGARRNQRTLKHRLECFNPRARVGRDSCL